MGKWNRRISIENAGCVDVDGKRLDLVAFSFRVRKGDRFTFGWGLAIPDVDMILKRHCYTRGRVFAIARWYTQGLWDINRGFTTRRYAPLTPPNPPPLSTL